MNLSTNRFSTIAGTFPGDNPDRFVGGGLGQTHGGEASCETEGEGKEC
jgi:hypothetical protein